MAKKPAAAPAPAAPEVTNQFLDIKVNALVWTANGNPDGPFIVGVVESIDSGGMSFVFQPFFRIERQVPMPLTGINPPRHVAAADFVRFAY